MCCLDQNTKTPRVRKDREKFAAVIQLLRKEAGAKTEPATRKEKANFSNTLGQVHQQDSSSLDLGGKG